MEQGNLKICIFLWLLFLLGFQLLQLVHVLAGQPHPFHGIVVELSLVEAVVGDLADSEWHLFEGSRVVLDVLEGEQLLEQFFLGGWL